MSAKRKAATVSLVGLFGAGAFAAGVAAGQPGAPEPDPGTGYVPAGAPPCASLDTLARGADTVEAFPLPGDAWQVNGRARPAEDPDSKLVRQLVAQPGDGERGEGRPVRLVAKRATGEHCWSFFLELGP